MWAVDVVSRPVRAAGMGGVAADAVSAEDSDQDGESPNSGGDDSVGLTDSPSRPAPTHDNSLQYHLDAVSVAVVKGGCVVQVSHEGQKDAEMGLAGNFSTLPPDSLGDKLIGDYKEKVSFCESPYNGETTSGSEEWSPRSMVDSSTQTGPGWEEGALLAARKRKSRTLEDVSDQHEVEVTEIKTHDRESQAGQSCLEVNMPLSSKISLVQRRQKQSNSDYSSLSSSDSPRVSDTSNRSDSGNSPGSSSSSSSTNGASIKTREPKFKKSSACGELSPIASCSGDSSVPAGLSVSVGLSPDPNGFVALSPDPSSKDLGSRSPCTPTSGCLKAGTRASSGAHVQFHTPYDNEEKGEEQQRLLHDTVVTQGGQVTLRKPPCSASTPTSGDLLPRLWTKLPDTSPAEVTSSLSIPKKWRGRHISGSSSISLGSSSSSSENSGATELERRAPDGGWGWVIVAASFMVHCIADGITMSFGVLFVELLSYFQEGKSLTSWVGSLFMAIPLLAGPLASILTDRYGCQTVTICGAVVASLGFFVSAFVNTIPLLLLTVGIITGLGLAVCYVAAIVIVAFYFEKKRSLATGIAVAGSGIGTFLFAPLIQHLMDNWGWRLSFILLAGVLLNMVVCGALMRDLEWTPRDSSSHRNTRSTPAPSSHRGSTSQSSETVGGRAGHLALPSLDELRRLVQSGDVAALLSPEEHSVETLRESASMVLLPTFLSRSQALPPDVIPCLSSRTNAYEVVSQMYPHLLSHSFSGTLDQVLPQGEKKSQKSQTHKENMPDYASTTLASIGSSGGCSQDNRAAAHGEAHPSDTDDTTPSSVPTPAPSTTSQAHKLDIQLGSSAEDDGDEADNEEENEDPQEGTAMLAQSRPTKGPRQPGPRRISGGCMGASSPPPPAAPLRNMKINRQSMTYRGAMLNIQRYRLRASSCPDIYRNSITTIAKAQDEADWTYLDDMSEMLTACVDVTYCMDASYLVFAVSNFVLYVFYDTVYMYLTDYAQGVGVSADDSANLISVIGILNCMGMVMMGYMGDRSWSSPMLMYNISMVMCGLSVLVMPFITNYWLIALAAAVFGLFISANYALTSVIVVELVSLESFSKAYGLLLMIQGVANLIGPPLVDLLKPANKSRDTSQDNFTMAVSKELRGRKVDISEPPPAVQRQASRRPATRSATETFLIGYPSSSISGSQLPTNRQAFQYFLHLQSLPENTGNPKHQDLANETVEAIIPFWQMARIKTMTKYNAAQHFMTLHKKHRDLARNKGRTGDPGGKRSAFVLELDSLFDIGASDAIQEIERNRLLSREKKDKDIRFYQDQKTERKAHMSGHDKIFESRSQQQAERAARLQQREEQDMNLSQNFYNFSAATQRRTAADVSTWADPTDSEGNAEDMDYQQPRPGCSHHQDTVTLTFPRRVMECVDICSTADRLGLSDNQVTALVSATLKAGGADLDKFVISTSTTRRNRMLTRYHISQEYMAAFSEDPPKYAALHWDGKMLRDVLGSDPGTTSETLAVLVSGPPAYPEGKLLGVPVIDSSTGTAQAEASMDLLEAWGLTGVITALVFDTTASNSGVHRGAAKLLEQQLDRKVFYLACRHHILEVLVGAVWENLFGKVKSPENPWFKHFKDVWTDLTTDNPTTLSIRQKWLNKKKKECKEILQEILRSEKPPRADYREMAELTLIVLGDTPPRGIHWSRPGAIHQARWMARNLYSMKMFMFAEQLEYDEETVVKLERLNLFLGLFYTPMWMSSTLAADAPANDLQFMKDMMKFKRTDPEIAQAVLQKLETTSGT